MIIKTNITTNSTLDLTTADYDIVRGVYYKAKNLEDSNDDEIRVMAQKAVKAIIKIYPEFGI